MKKHAIIKMMAGAMLAFTTLKADAQMTLIQSSNSAYYTGVANLLLSGKKYYVFDNVASQVRLYNLNHSLWKTINIPATVSGLTFNSNDVPQYISENLFKLDGLVDMSIVYQGTGFSSNVIINETGAVVNIADSVQHRNRYFRGMYSGVLSKHLQNILVARYYSVQSMFKYRQWVRH